jgi:hypothetical protein
MSTSLLFVVEFQVVKKNASTAQKPFLYRRDIRKAQIIAASVHPNDLLTTLNADITLASGESIDILSVRQINNGTEGPNVLG